MMPWNSRSVQAATEAIRNGQMVILVDDEDRENEGDLVLAAEKVTPQAINFMATHGRGLICLALSNEKVDALELPMMVSQNRSPKQTAFTVSIEAKDGVTTGISAYDRAHTIRTAVHPAAKPGDIVSPGHVFPLRAKKGGVLARPGHTEGSVDLVKMAGCSPAAVICEVLNLDGSMARLPNLEKFSETHDVPILRIRELIQWRIQNEVWVEPLAECDFPSRYGNFRLFNFKSLLDDSEHVALVKLRDDSTQLQTKEPVLIRVHSECLTGDALASLRCDCGPQLEASFQKIAESSQGVIVYLRNHEGRGIGLGNKVRAYSLQDRGMDTVQANHSLGFPDDLRRYGIAAQILKYFGIRECRLLTNNPKKVSDLESPNLKVLERIPLEITPNIHNHSYLKTKMEKMGHILTKNELYQ